MRTAADQQVEAEWLRYSEAEKYAGLGRSTLFSLVQSGRIRGAKVGKAVRLSRRSIDSYMEGQSVADGTE
jgi:excisionase family DNA binding protein